MRKEEIVGLAVRLFAVYLAISTIGNIGSLIAFLRMGAAQEISYGILVPAIGIPLSVALIFWLLPLTIARKLLPTVEDQVPRESQVTLADYQVVAFSVLGMWVLAEYVPTVFYWVGYAAFLHSNPEQALTVKEYGKFASHVVGILIGFWLLFGARGIVGILRAARYAGTK